MIVVSKDINKNEIGWHMKGKFSLITDFYNLPFYI